MQTDEKTILSEKTKLKYVQERKKVGGVKIIVVHTLALGVRIVNIFF